MAREWKASEAEATLLMAIDNLVGALLHQKLVPSSLTLRANVREARRGIGYAVRQYGAWLVSEDGHSSLAVWDADRRAQEAREEVESTDDGDEEVDRVL